MGDTVENLILDLVEWVGRRERTYHETMDAWRTSCPRLPIWEDATDLGLIETAFADGRSLVRVTQAGLGLLKERRPHCFEQPQRPVQANQADPA
jgi:hypothetical protein